MKIKLAILFLTGAAFFTPGIAVAGEPDSLHDRMQQAQWVGWLQVASSRSLVNAAMSRGSELIVIDGYRYTANVVHQWKGDLGERIEFDVGLSDCHQRLGLDQQLIVFGELDYEGRYRVLSCDNIVANDEVPSLLHQLGMSPGQLPVISSR